VEALSLLSLVPSSALTSSAASSIVDADEPKYRGSARERELKTLIEQAAREIMTWKPLIGVVIRSGGLGACVVRHKHRADAELPVDIDSSLEVCWIPAYHQPLRLSDGSYAMNPAIVDVTGGGNAFLGGLAAGLQLHRGDLVSAALCGSVGASFAIEQDGLPALEVRDGQERWNGALAEERLQELAERFRL
jgi:sugar/nucleoside kinase (ribokinase family)